MIGIRPVKSGKAAKVGRQGGGVSSNPTAGHGLGAKTETALARNKRLYSQLPKYVKTIIRNLHQKYGGSEVGDGDLGASIQSVVSKDDYVDGPAGARKEDISLSLKDILSETRFAGVGEAHDLMEQGVYYAAQRDNPFSIHFDEKLSNSGAHSSVYQSLYGGLTGRGFDWNGHDEP